MLFIAPLASRAEDANQACSDGRGITLVVDFQSLGGGVNVRCAPQPVSNGYDVFQRTNVSYETVSGKDFVCKIAALPEDANCSAYPPGNYYWSYWWAKPGEQWQYSTKGAGAHKPSPGAYEGWSFVNSDTASPPRYPPPPAPTTTTAAATATTATATPPAPAAPATTTRGRSSPSTERTTTPTAVATTTSSPPENSTSTTETSLALGHVDLTRRSGGGGTSVGFILSGLAVFTFGAGAVAFLRGRGR
jgi:hypothetical protein